MGAHWLDWGGERWAVAGNERKRRAEGARRVGEAVVESVGWR